MRRLFRRLRLPFRTLAPNRFPEMSGILFFEELPIRWQVQLVEDRLDGAFGHACAAVDAGVRVDVELLD